MTQLTAEQVYSIARAAGWGDLEVSPGVSEAACITAIAGRESSWCPGAINPNLATGDYSFGLAMLNMAVPGVPGELVKAGAMGITNTGVFMVTDLLDPNKNLRAAMVLYGHSKFNLGLLWYVYLTNPTPEQARDQVAYESHLPAALAAEAAWKAART